MKNAILIVDDEAGIRTVLDVSLVDMGHVVYQAETGAQALQLFRDVRPSIILTDIKMPGMSGIDLLKAVKSLDRDVEVIMITGHGDMDLAVKSLKHEATDFITKPIGFDALEVAIKRALDRISMRRQIKDYTENLEHLVREKTRELIEAERFSAVGEAIAGLSHSIKNIAGGLKGGAFVLEKGLELHDDKYLRQGWNMVKGNVDKIAKLSMDLLNFGKSSELNLRLTDPNKPVVEVMDLIKPLADKSGVRIDVFLSKDLQPVYMDAEAIGRCLNNLVLNAIEACEEKMLRGSSVVSLKTISASGFGVEYKIEDNGCGMDDETYDKLFQGFFTTKGSRGTGIGLMTTKKIVEKHHGSIQVESQKGKGTLFVIKLPGKRVDHDNAAVYA